MYDGSKWVDVLNSDASIPGDLITGNIDAAQLDGELDGGSF
jgi:hypothetical protein